MTTTHLATDQDRWGAVETRATHSVSTFHLTLLLAITLLAFGLRIHKLGKPSFWFDETASVLTASGNWERLFDRTTGYADPAPDVASPTALGPLRNIWFEGDSHPPLYFFLLRGWWTFFGMSDVSCRALSVTASLLTIPILFDVTRLIAGTIPALWACAIMAVAPPQVEYAQEARAYALAILLGVASCDAMLRLHRFGANRWRFIALAIASAASVMTHYFMIGGVLGLTLFAAAALRGRVRTISVIILLVTLALPLVRLPIFLAHGNDTNMAIEWLAEPRAGLLGRTIERVLTLPVWFLLRPLEQDMALGSCGVLLLILPFFLNRKRPALALAAFWSCGIIGMVAIADLALARSALLYIRYTLAASPMVYVSLVAIADIGGKWTRHLMPIIVLIGASLALPDMYQSIANRKPEVRELASDIRAHVSAQDVLIIASSPKRGLYSATTEYNEIAYYASPIPCAVAILEAPADARDARQINSHSRIWLVNCWGSGGPDDAVNSYRVHESFPMHYQAGRLYLVEPAVPSTEPH